MKYKFGKKDIAYDIPETVMIGETEIPDYNFNFPESFNEFGLVEFMEGIFEFPSKSESEVRIFLNSLGYKESK